MKSFRSSIKVLKDPIHPPSWVVSTGQQRSGRKRWPDPWRDTVGRDVVSDARNGRCAEALAQVDEEAEEREAGCTAWRIARRIS